MQCVHLRLVLEVSSEKQQPGPREKGPGCVYESDTYGGGIGITLFDCYFIKEFSGLPNTGQTESLCYKSSTIRVY